MRVLATFAHGKRFLKTGNNDREEIRRTSNSDVVTIHQHALCVYAVPPAGREAGRSTYKQSWEEGITALCSTPRVPGRYSRPALLPPTV